MSNVKLVISLLSLYICSRLTGEYETKSEVQCN